MSTISFTPKASTAFFRVLEINTLFEAVATVLNAKLDIGEPALDTSLNIGMQPIVNVGESIEDDDAATSGELQDWAPVETHA